MRVGSAEESNIWYVYCSKAKYKLNNKSDMK